MDEIVMAEYIRAKQGPDLLPTNGRRLCCLPPDSLQLVRRVRYRLDPVLQHTREAFQPVNAQEGARARVEDYVVETRVVSGQGLREGLDRNEVQEVNLVVCELDSFCGVGREDVDEVCGEGREGLRAFDSGAGRDYEC